MLRAAIALDAKSIAGSEPSVETMRDIRKGASPLKMNRSRRPIFSLLAFTWNVLHPNLSLSSTSLLLLLCVLHATPAACCENQR
jgi:hypothetical protein